MSKNEYMPCGGCGAPSPDQRCLGCLHNFGAGSWNLAATLFSSPSDAEPVAWQWRQSYAGTWGYWNDCGLLPTDQQKWIDLAKKLPNEVQVRPLYAAPPAAVQEPVAVKALEWSDPAEPNETCRYNHVIAKAVFVYSIEWKAWKKYDAFTVYRDGEFLDSLATLDDAKAAAQADYESRIRSALSTSTSDPAPEIAELEWQLDHQHTLHDNLNRKNEGHRAKLSLAEDEIAALRAEIERLPAVCDGKEQYAFEAWAKSEGFDMHEHPLFYRFMDHKTNAARQAWKAAIRYCATTLAPQQEEAK